MNGRNSLAEDSVFDRDERRFAVRLCRPLGRLEGSRDRQMAAYLHPHHRRPNKLVRDIHTGMPVILPGERYDAWLSGEAGKEILTVPRLNE